MALWLALYHGKIALAIAWGPLDWHVHEMLYGYVTAVVAGFLLTAIPNWTGRLPVNGATLAALTGLWLLGRVAILAATSIGATVAAVVDIAFLVALAAVAMREIVAGKNWRNLRILAVLIVLIAGNIVFHAEAAWFGAAIFGPRIGIAAVLVLIMLVGGRIIPSFTHNLLARADPGRMPRPFTRFDAFAVMVAALALALWITWPTRVVVGLALVVAGCLHLVRLARWAGERTFGDRIVFVLHAGYAFVPAGFLLAGAAAIWPAVPQGAGVHSWTAGAFGLMTLAVMTRAALGHTGRPLAASAATQAIYLLAFIAALARVAASFSASMLLLDAAFLCWIVAFGGFAILYGPMLVRPRER